MVRMLRTALAWHGPLAVFGTAMAVLAVGSVAALALDDRVLLGAPIWAKPLKFAVSLGLYAFTFAWLLSLMGRAPRWAWWVGTVVAVTGLVEIAVIVGQAVRGRQSHFNVMTTVDGALWSLMAVAIAVLWVANLVAAVLLLRQPLGDLAGRWALQLGLLLAVAGMGLGYLMTSPTAAQSASPAKGVTTVVGAHAVGVPDGGPGLPLVNWSTTGGDLRVPHFVGIHGLQALPLFGWLIARRPGRFDGPTRLRLVWLAAAAYGGLTALLTWQALRGQPLLAPDGLTLGALGALLAAIAVGSWAALARNTHPAAVAVA